MVELLRRIKNHAPHFPKDQDPQLFDRDHIGATYAAGRIMLHPLQTEGSRDKACPKEDLELDRAKRQTITLHFDFDYKPELAHVETLGKELNFIFEHNMLNVNRVRWGGLKPSMVVQALQTWIGHRDTNLKRRHPTLATDYSDDCTPEPPTPSSTSQQSPRAQDIFVAKDSNTDPSLLSPNSPVHRRDDREHQTQGRYKRRKPSPETENSQ